MYHADKTIQTCSISNFVSLVKNLLKSSVTLEERMGPVTVGKYMKIFKMSTTEFINARASEVCNFFLVSLKSTGYLHNLSQQKQTK
jgi:hypothetical protein